VHLHHLDRHRLPETVEKELNLTHHDNLESLTKVCDGVTLNCPLHPETEHMINDKTLKNFMRGSYLVNTARRKLRDRDAIVRALESGHGRRLTSTAAAAEPPWRTMPHHGMTPHISGTSLPAQTRDAAGTREILECYFANKPIRNKYQIVQGGKLAGVGAHSYSPGNATGGSEEAAKFKR
jgi:formate dehydrogenase